MRARPGVVEALGLDQGEGDVAGQLGVVGEVDLLLPAFAEEALDGIAAVGEGGGEGGGGGGRCGGSFLGSR